MKIVKVMVFDDETSAKAIRLSPYDCLLGTVLGLPLLLLLNFQYLLSLVHGLAGKP